VLTVLDNNNKLKVPLLNVRIQLVEINIVIGDQLIDILFLDWPLAFRGSLAELNQ
jgi:hypothetical protein